MAIDSVPNPSSPFIPSQIPDIYENVSDPPLLSLDEIRERRTTHFLHLRQQNINQNEQPDISISPYENPCASFMDGMIEQPAKIFTARIHRMNLKEDLIKFFKENIVSFNLTSTCLTKV